MSPRLWDATMPAPIAGPPLDLSSGFLSLQHDTTPHTEALSIIPALKHSPATPRPSPLHNTIYSKSNISNTPSELLVKCASVVSTLTLASTNSAPVSEGRPPGSNVCLCAELDRRSTGLGLDPEPLLAFNLAFNTPVPFFKWLEDGGLDTLSGNSSGAGCFPTGVVGNIMSAEDHGAQTHSGHVRNMSMLSMQSGCEPAFDWLSLPRGSTIVDIGGGIRSTTMILA
ncbi:hypothetical protein BDR05DRAFT_998898 [Suillus weaverae]|nr:hypothetical protein BDR05DRAFT_998898 [Suillus weaverae]